MPARKPKALIKRHETAAERRQREERESSLQPGRELSERAPARLKGHPIAEATWRRLMRVYGQIEGQIVTMMDQDLLIDYCVLSEQVAELDELRKSAFEVWQKLEKRWTEVESELHGKELLAAVVQLQSAFTDVVKLDGRVDRKRALLLQLRQSLYLTPRARAGAAPAKKEAPEEPDEMEKLLDDVTDFVNEPKDKQ